MVKPNEKFVINQTKSYSLFSFSTDNLLRYPGERTSSFDYQLGDT